MACKFQLSNFTYVDRPKRTLGKALRFTLGIQIELLNGMMAEMAIEGCLAFTNYMGKIAWQPPLVQWGKRSRQLHWMNPTFYNIVVDAIEEQPEFVKNLKRPIQELYETQPGEGYAVTPTVVEKVNI